MQEHESRVYNRMAVESSDRLECTRQHPLKDVSRPLGFSIAQDVLCGLHRTRLGFRCIRDQVALHLDLWYVSPYRAPTSCSTFHL